MAYSTGMMHFRVTIAKRKSDDTATFGKSGQPKYEILGTFWAGETFNKGQKSLREGAFDAYDIIMFRMRYNANIDRWCLIKFHGKWYQIQSFNDSFQENEIQITAIEMANQQVNIVEPTSEPTPGPTPTSSEDESQDASDESTTSSDENDNKNK